MRNYFALDFRGHYCDIEIDYDIYDQPYQRGDEGLFSGEALIPADTPEEAKRIVRERIEDRFGDDFSVDIECEVFDTSDYNEEEVKDLEEFSIWEA